MANPLLLALAIFPGALSVGAGYADPPSWDPMIMLNVSLDANNRLAVETTSTMVRLTPAPGSFDISSQTYDLSVASYDPSKSWAVLNGTAYSRVLGWYDQGTTGANGDNFYLTYATQLKGNFLWIEKTGGSPELRTYAVSEAGDPTGPYLPIFGTDGSSTKWRWDGFMDHNANAVALTNLAVSNQIFTATYRLFVGDASGQAVAGYGETTTTWTWQGPAIPYKPANAPLIIDNVPMQGSMLMPVISYHADDDRVTVDLSGINQVAQLTPLSLSHPDTGFNPADPWYDYLNPNRQGLAFSRRYGFEMDPNTDLLPGDRQIWLRKLAGPSELGIYRYSMSDPKTWTPVFGTEGSSNAVYWSGLMWHPAVTAPARTNTLSATFDAYLVDTGTALEVPGSHSGPFDLHWTVASDGRPQLSVALNATNGVVLSWPLASGNWTLVSAPEASSTVWMSVTNASVSEEGITTVILAPSATQRYFRLKSSP